MELGILARGTRAAAFAGVCVWLSAVGHALMSGVPVPSWCLAPAAVCVAAAVWPFTGRERRAVPVTAAAVAVQGLLHVLFALAQSAAGPGGSPPGHGGHFGLPSGAGGNAPHAGHRADPSGGGGHAEHLAAGPPTHRGPHQHHEHDGPLDPFGLLSAADLGPGGDLGMTAAHLLLALGGGAWLSCGERAAFRLLRALRAWLARPLTLPRAGACAPPRPAHPLPPGPAPLPRRPRLAHVIVTRGPPPRPVPHDIAHGFTPLAGSRPS